MGNRLITGVRSEIKRFKSIQDITKAKNNLSFTIFGKEYSYKEVRFGKDFNKTEDQQALEYAAHPEYYRKAPRNQYAVEDNEAYSHMQQLDQSQPTQSQLKTARKAKQKSQENNTNINQNQNNNKSVFSKGENKTDQPPETIQLYYKEEIDENGVSTWVVDKNPEPYTVPAYTPKVKEEQEFISVTQSESQNWWTKEKVSKQEEEEFEKFVNTPYGGYPLEKYDVSVDVKSGKEYFMEIQEKYQEMFAQTMRQSLKEREKLGIKVAAEWDAPVSTANSNVKNGEYNFMAKQEKEDMTGFVNADVEPGCQDFAEKHKGRHQGFGWNKMKKMQDENFWDDDFRYVTDQAVIDEEKQNKKNLEEFKDEMEKNLKEAFGVSQVSQSTTVSKKHVYPDMNFNLSQQMEKKATRQVRIKSKQQQHAQTNEGEANSITQASLEHNNFNGSNAGEEALKNRVNKKERARQGKDKDRITGTFNDGADKEIKIIMPNTSNTSNSSNTATTKVLQQQQQYQQQLSAQDKLAEEFIEKGEKQLAEEVAHNHFSERDTMFLYNEQDKLLRDLEKRMSDIAQGKDKTYNFQEKSAEEVERIKKQILEDYESLQKEVNYWKDRAKDDPQKRAMCQRVDELKQKYNIKEEQAQYMGGKGKPRKQVSKEEQIQSERQKTREKQIQKQGYAGPYRKDLHNKNKDALDQSYTQTQNKVQNAVLGQNIDAENIESHMDKLQQRMDEALKNSGRNINHNEFESYNAQLSPPEYHFMRKNLEEIENRNKTTINDNNNYNSSDEEEKDPIQFLQKLQRAKQSDLFLTQKQAMARREKLAGNVRYDLQLNAKEGEEYTGVSTVSFNLKDASKGIFLDYQGDTLNEILVNGVLIKQGQDINYMHIWDGAYINIDKGLLQTGDNTVAIRFTNKYAVDGNGLHSYVDQDKQQYIYSNLEPNSLTKVFPCFDQPDIKGNFKLRCIANKEWLVISNENVESTEMFSKSAFTEQNDTENGNYQNIAANAKASTIDYDALLEGCNKKTHKIWDFNLTPAISTYLYGINVGPFEQIELAPDECFNNIPMSVYCRKSLYQHCLEKTAPKVFEVAYKTLEFFVEYFDREYPFNKYDHVFCPEFNSGAMENPGCVTMNDELIFKDDVTLDAVTHLALTVAHEMAHMWFGNLVTMRWWNDLWLNESFADFISFHALKDIELSFKTADILQMQFQNKSWGMIQDQLSTTHPIACEVPNTEVAQHIFDGISYSKGAAVIQQLNHLIGDEAFKAGVQVYFKKFEWGNATLDDFMSTVTKVFKEEHQLYNNELDDTDFDFNLWQRDWIQKAGLNIVHPENFNSASDEAEEHFTIVQSAVLPQHPTLRPHKMKIGFFDHDGWQTEQDILLPAASSHQQKYDASITSAIMLNLEGHAYTKVRFDQSSSAFFRQNLSKLHEPLTRLQIWSYFYDAVRDGQMSSRTYLETVLQNCSAETDINILQESLEQGLNCIHFYSPIDNFKPMQRQMFDLVYKLLCDQTNEGYIGKDRETLLKGILVESGHNLEHIDDLKSWFYRKLPQLSPFVPTLYQKWKIVNRLFQSQAYDDDEKRKIFTVQASSDNSDMAHYQKIKCDSTIADNANRERIWNGYLDKRTKMSLHEIRHSMKGFNHRELPKDQIQKYSQLYFEQLPIVYRSRDKDFADVFAETLFPTADNLQGHINKLQCILDETSEDRDISLRKFCLETIDTMRRRLSAAECFKAHEKKVLEEQEQGKLGAKKKRFLFF